MHLEPNEDERKVVDIHREYVETFGKLQIKSIYGERRALFPSNVNIVKQARPFNHLTRWRLLTDENSNRDMSAIQAFRSVVASSPDKGLRGPLRTRSWQRILVTSSTASLRQTSAGSKCKQWWRTQCQHILVRHRISTHTVHGVQWWGRGVRRLIPHLL